LAIRAAADTILDYSSSTVDALVECGTSAGAAREVAWLAHVVYRTQITIHSRRAGTIRTDGIGILADYALLVVNARAS